MRSFGRSIYAAMLISTCAVVPTTFAFAQTTRGEEPPTGTAVYSGDELLRDYLPKPSLVTKETIVSKPFAPVVDFHCHWTLAQDPAAMLRDMDTLGVRRAVNLSGGFGANLDAMLEKFLSVSPDRFVIFANLDLKRIDEPAFGTLMSAEIERARTKGARGLKIFKNLGLTVKDGQGKVVPVDDPRFDPIWETCGRLGMPVLIHSADPVAFFRPVDRDNERWMQLKRHPGWSFFGPEYPKYEDVIAQHLRVVAKHPGTNFVSAHLINSGENLSLLASWLDRYPNLFVDLSGRVSEIGRQPYAARKFLVKYADRVLFGTDRYPGRPDQPRYTIYYRFLETDDEYFNYYDHPFPPEGEWRIYGVFLPPDALGKIYQHNAEALLAPTAPADAGIRP